jgi:CubicO group peptidase (beta-lactamase class C family)
MKRLFVLVALLATLSLSAQPLKRVHPKKVGMDAKRLEKIDDLMKEAIDNKDIPGAVVAVVKDGKLAYIKAFGNKSVYPEVVPMTENTVFDLASCSKVVGTAMSMAHLLERGGYRLTDRVSM